MKFKITKRHGKLILVLIPVIFFISTSFISIKKRDCNPLILMEEAVKRLKKFTLIKDYPFNFKAKKKKGEAEFLKQTITLNRDVRYKFLAVENPDFEGKPIINIYLNDKRDVLIATNYESDSKKFYKDIEFECKTTGNYCLTFSFQDGMEGCAVGVHAFLK